MTTTTHTPTTTGDHHSGEYEWYSNGGHQCGCCTETTDREDLRGAGGDFIQTLDSCRAGSALQAIPLHWILQTMTSWLLCRQWIKLSIANNCIEYYKHDVIITYIDEPHPFLSKVLQLAIRCLIVSVVVGIVSADWQSLPSKVNNIYKVHIN